MERVLRDVAREAAVGVSLSAGRLDLRAIEARLNATEVCYECRADMQALLAHVRALRAALQRLNDARHGSSTKDDVMETIAAHRNADAVLRAAGDAAGAAPEETQP